MLPGPAVRVELDVFSGRPNPTWPLTPPQVQKLMSMLGRLSLGGRQEPGGLGWRGFLLHRLDSIGTSRLWLRVADGAVSVNEGGGHVYRDTEGIEAWLRDQAERHGFSSLLVDASTK